MYWKSTLLVMALAFAPSAIAGEPSQLVQMKDWTGLSAPLGLTHAGDGSGRIFIAEQGGKVRVVDEGGALRSSPFIDLGNRTSDDNFEQGLLDIAFHPDFANNGRFFLHYTAGTTRPGGTRFGDSIVAEFFSAGGNEVDSAEPLRTILTVAQDFSNHNGGQMKFGPDGYLYLALGDGGRGGDPCDRAQTTNPDQLVEPSSCESNAPLDDSLALLGKILRLDVDASTPAGDSNLCGASAGGAAEYAVPLDNPYVRDTQQPQENRCAEIWHYGLRNPWRFSFDRDTGDLWIGDVGQNQWEEIDFLEAPIVGGVNFGWDCYEASSAFELAGCPSESELSFPVLEYDHATTGGCSVTGGYRYRGPVSALRGSYVFGDFCSGEIWLATQEGAGWTRDLFASGFGGLRSFGEDEAGNVYAIANGRVYRFEGSIELLFKDGFEP